MFLYIMSQFSILTVTNLERIENRDKYQAREKDTKDRNAKGQAKKQIQKPAIT